MFQKFNKNCSYLSGAAGRKEKTRTGMYENVYDMPGVGYAQGLVELLEVVLDELEEGVLKEEACTLATCT